MGNVSSKKPKNREFSSNLDEMTIQIPLFDESSENVIYNSNLDLSCEMQNELVNMNRSVFNTNNHGENQVIYTCQMNNMAYFDNNNPGHNYIFGNKSAEMIYSNQFMNQNSIQLSQLTSYLISDDMSRFNIFSKLDTFNQDIKTQINGHLFSMFDQNGNGMLSKYELDKIITQITCDKLFFEKIDIEINRKIFNQKQNELNTRVKMGQVSFLNDLQSAKINYFSNVCTIENIQKFIQDCDDRAQQKSNRIKHLKKLNQIGQINKDKKPEGFGFLQRTNGHYYGQFEDGMLNGVGYYYLYKERQSRQGCWLDNKLTRDMIIRFHLDNSDTKVIEEWIGNVNDNVKLTGYANLIIYDKATNQATIKNQKRGMFENGKLNGYSQVKHSSGDQLEGFLQEDIRHGFSYQFFCKTGDTYIGRWQTGERHGYGEYQQSDKSYQRGNWAGNTMEGWGQYRWDAEDTDQEGMFHNNLKQGYGRLRKPLTNQFATKKEYKIQEGIFSNNKIVKDYKDANYNICFNYVRAE